MSEIWMLSDTHFGHKNIIQYENRPFQTIEEHDQCLIENWNSHIKNGDRAWFVGDLAIGNVSKIQSVLNRLHGQIWWIKGNHDSSKTIKRLKGNFHFEPTGEKKIGDDFWILHHYACRVWRDSHHGSYHIFGHSHGNLLDDPHARSMDVGIDATADRFSLERGDGILRPEDYRPLHYDEVKAFLDKKVFIPVDHHIEGME